METTENNVILIGYLGANPVFKELAGGKALAKVSLATSEQVKDKAGNFVNRTTWHDLIFWGKNAHMANDNFKKGNKVKISGKIVPNTYKTPLGETITKIQVQVRTGYAINSKN